MDISLRSSFTAEITSLSFVKFAGGEPKEGVCCHPHRQVVRSVLALERGFFIYNINNTGRMIDPCCNSTVGGKGSDTYGILNFNDFLTLGLVAFEPGTRKFGYTNFEKFT